MMDDLAPNHITNFDAQLLSQLSCKAVLQRLALFLFTSGKLPKAAQMSALPALGDKISAFLVNDRGGNVHNHTQAVMGEK